MFITHIGVLNKIVSPLFLYRNSVLFIRLLTKPKSKSRSNKIKTICVYIKIPLTNELMQLFLGNWPQNQHNNLKKIFMPNIGLCYICNTISI